MEIKPSPNTETSKYHVPEDELNVFYGLPREVKFCSVCNISNQQPMSSNEYEHSKDALKTTMEFDDNDISHACRFHESKRNEQENLLRISVGLENKEDLLNDLLSALK